MAKKLTLEAVKERLSAINSNIEVLSDIYISSASPLDLRCLRCSFEWQASFNNLACKKSRCPRCSKRFKLTIKEVRERVATTNPSVEILSKKYARNSAPLHCRCLKCDHEWHATFNNLAYSNKKTGCPKCAVQRRMLTLSEVKERLHKIHPNIEILSSLYQGTLVPLQCRCLKCGNDWNASYNNLSSKFTGCPRCAKEVKSQKMRLPTDVFLSRVPKNIQILEGTYKNEASKFKCKCLTCGEVSVKTAKSLTQSKFSCTQCGGKQKLTINEVKKRLSRLPIEILSDSYEQSNSPLQCRCKLCGNRWVSSFSVLKYSKIGCPVCGISQRASQKRKSFKEVKTQIEKTNPLIFLEPQLYINTHSALKCRCLKCEAEWGASAVSLITMKSGCPRCARQYSSIEIDFLNAFEGWAKDRKILGGKELDAYFAKEKLAIEINGCFWHSTYQTRITKNYHLDKTNICEKKGIKLLHFWDFEIKESFEFCRQIVLENLGLLNDIDDFDTREIEPLHFILYDSNDIKRSNLKLKHIGSNSYEIIEFNGSNKQNLYDYFVSKYKPLKIKATLNRRFYSVFDNYALKLGFKLDKITKPSYFKFKNGKKYSKNYFKAKNFAKCYDCGTLAYSKSF